MLEMIIIIHNNTGFTSLRGLERGIFKKKYLPYLMKKFLFGNGDYYFSKNLVFKSTESHKTYEPCNYIQWTLVYASPLNTYIGLIRTISFLPSHSNYC